MAASSAPMLFQPASAPAATTTDSKGESKEEKALDPREIEYQRRLAIYEEQQRGKSALERHVALCLDPNGIFSGSTIKALLNQMHASGAFVKGNVIAAFNASHSKKLDGICPAMSAAFTKDADNYARFLHMGTTRIWNADGSINEECMTRLRNAVIEDNRKAGREGQTHVTVTFLKSYLAGRLATDPEDKPDVSNRHVSPGLFNERGTQSTAATAAWDQVFESLTCGYGTDAKGKPEPYLTWEITEMFFRNSGAAYLRAVCKLLPAPKPKEPSHCLVM